MMGECRGDNLLARKRVSSIRLRVKNHEIGDLISFVAGVSRGIIRQANRESRAALTTAISVRMRPLCI